VATRSKPGEPALDAKKPSNQSRPRAALAPNEIARISVES
jgi:hypothetical protein